MTSTSRPDAEDVLLTPEEVAQITKLHTTTLAARRHRGTGPAYIKLSPGRTGHVRYWRSAVYEWLATAGLPKAS